MAKAKAPRAIMCVWCGEYVVYDTKTVTAKEAIEIMKSHDQACPKNPLVRENQALKARIKRLIRGTCLN